jgi:hypothetical protein
MKIFYTKGITTDDRDYSEGLLDFKKSFPISMKKYISLNKEVIIGILLIGE